LKKFYQEIYVDNDIIVVNKAHGLLSIPDRFDKEKVNLLDLLKRKYEEVIPVHRIDKDTSGLIVFALNAEAHHNLSKQFQEREIQKIYTAIVYGYPPQDNGVFDQSILIHEGKHKVSIHRSGKSAITEYELIEKFLNFSYLKLMLITGRRHQIRAHLAYNGLPIVSDPMYGKSPSFFLSEIKGRKYNIKKYENERPLTNRQLLHATEIAFKHPRTSELMEFEAKLPKDMKAMLYQLEKLNTV